MSCNGIKKSNQRILCKDIYAFISRNTSLSEKQVQECFNAYYQMILAIIESEHKSQDMEITLPKIGVFYFTKKKGYKKGQKFKIPNLTTGEEDVIILEEDEPDYEQIRFRIHTKLKNKNKQETRKKYLKWENIDKTT
jgi:nucleoid DNA-binding protein